MEEYEKVRVVSTLALNANPPSIPPFAVHFMIVFLAMTTDMCKECEHIRYGGKYMYVKFRHFPYKEI